MFKDSIPIPSKGLFYDGQPEYLDVYYITTEDELNFTAINSFAKGDALKNLLIKNVCTPNNLKYDDLLINDKEFILLFLKDTAYGYILDYKDDDGSIYFDSQNVQIKNIEKLPDSNGLFTFNFNNDTFKIKLLKVVDEKRISKNKKLTYYIEHIFSINDNQDKTYISSYINYQSLTNIKKIKKFIDSINFGVNKKTFAIINNKRSAIDLVIDESLFGLSFKNLNKIAKNVNDSISFLMNEGNGFTMDGILKMPTHIRKFHEEKLINRINKINENMKT